MLLYRVWRSINYKIDGMLCLLCAEKRLGRGLTRQDFSRARLNAAQAKVCPALAVRLARDARPVAQPDAFASAPQRQRRRST